MKPYKCDPTRYENKAIAALQQMNRERIEQGWHPSLLTLALKPLQDKRSLPLDVIGTCLGQFYSLVLTRLIHHPRRGSVARLPFMVGMPDLPVFKHCKVSAVATMNDGLHAHAIFLTPPFSRNGGSLAAVLGEHGDLIMDICHLTSVDCRDITDTPDKATSYVLKSLDLNRFDGDSIWIFPKSSSEVLRARGIGRANP